MAKTTVTGGWINIPDWLGKTAYPFAIGSQEGTAGTRPWAWDDFMMSPKYILPVIALPIAVIYLTFKYGRKI